MQKSNNKIDHNSGAAGFGACEQYFCAVIQLKQLQPGRSNPSGKSAISHRLESNTLRRKCCHRAQRIRLFLAPCCVVILLLYPGNRKKEGTKQVLRFACRFGQLYLLLLIISFHHLIILIIIFKSASYL